MKVPGTCQPKGATVCRQCGSLIPVVGHKCLGRVARRTRQFPVHCEAGLSVLMYSDLERRSTRSEATHHDNIRLTY